jgi:hypothetical protein
MSHERYKNPFFQIQLIKIQKTFSPNRPIWILKIRLLSNKIYSRLIGFGPNVFYLFKFEIEKSVHTKSGILIKIQKLGKGERNPR